MRSILRAIVMLPLALAWIGPVLAQTYPERTIKIFVPQPPGGGFDTVARVLADRLLPLLGQPLVVENRPGAGTLVGTEAAAKSPADGYTPLLGALSNIALNPGLYERLFGQWRTFAACAGRPKKGLAQLGGGQALALANAGSTLR